MTDRGCVLYLNLLCCLCTFAYNRTFLLNSVDFLLIEIAWIESTFSRTFLTFQKSQKTSFDFELQILFCLSSFPTTCGNETKHPTDPNPKTKSLFDALADLFSELLKKNRPGRRSTHYLLRSTQFLCRATLIIASRDSFGLWVGRAFKYSTLKWIS